MCSNLSALFCTGLFHAVTARLFANAVATSLLDESLRKVTRIAHEFADYIPSQFAYNIPGDLEYSQHAIKIEKKASTVLVLFLPFTNMVRTH